jgi:hypothetical protein
MKFQKHISLFLAFFVLVSNIGFAFNVHYCDNQIASVSFNTTSPNTLDEDCCGMIEKTSHCCKDKVVVIQKKSDQAIIKSFSFQWNDSILPIRQLTVSNRIDAICVSKSAPAYYCESNAPPLFKLYSQYIFYDQV